MVVQMKISFAHFCFYSFEEYFIIQNMPAISVSNGLKFPIMHYALMPVTIITGYFLLRNLQRLQWSKISI